MNKLSVIRNIVLLAIAIILVEAIIGQPMFLALLVVPFAYGWQQLRRKHEGKSASLEKRFQTVEEAEAELGAPDGTILTDATRGNELAGNILVYRSRRLLVIDGVEVNRVQHGRCPHTDQVVVPGQLDIRNGRYLFHQYSDIHNAASFMKKILFYQSIVIIL